MRRSVCLPTGIMDDTTTFTIFLDQCATGSRKMIARHRFVDERTRWISHERKPAAKQLLQMLDVADFDLLRPHLVTVELVRGLPGRSWRDVTPRLLPAQRIRLDHGGPFRRTDDRGCHAGSRQRRGRRGGTRRGRRSGKTPSCCSQALRQCWRSRLSARSPPRARGSAA